MYREDVENYPKNYAKTNVDKILNAIDTSMSVSFFAPSGFGKSSLAKYLAFNRSYKSRYPKLRRIKFVYINLSEIAAETFEEAQSLTVYNPIELNKQKRFLEILLRSFLESESSNTPEEIQDNLRIFNQSDPKSFFYSHIEGFLKRYKNKLTVLLLDGVETLTKEGFESQREFLKNFRDQYRSRIEYLFIMDNLKHLDKLNRKNWGGLIELISQKIELMHMPKTEECITPKHIDQPFWYFNLITVHTAKFRERLKLVGQWSGGYPPYFKYLFRLSSKESLVTLAPDRELELFSERLYSSLCEEHQKVLLDLVRHNKFDENYRESKELLELGIIVKENNKLRLFSPIFQRYLMNIGE